MKRIQKQSIWKYDQTIAFAKTQPQRNKPDERLMLEKIGIDWHSDYCPYCEKYLDFKKSNACFNCPLSNNEKSTIGSENCCNGLWEKMNKAKTWKTWRKYAELIIEYIKEHG
jgi:hypothetical protein